MTGTLTIVDDGIGREAWNEFVSTHPSGHFFQTWEWGVLQEGLAARPQRLGVVRGGALAGVVQLLHFDTGRRKFAYVPRGPVADADDTETAGALTEAVTRAAYAAGADFIRLEPEWEYTDALAAHLTSSGWTRAKQFIMPRRTMLVDLRPDPQTIWERFRSNTRNRIRLAGKLGVEVRVGGEQDVPTFIRLSEETDARHEMRRSDPDQYTLAWRHFGARDAMRLYLARAENQDLAGLMVFICGQKATYLWGGSTSAPEARKYNPNQLLHWTAMQWARARGCTVYDLHGIPDYDLEVLEAEYARQTGGMWNLYRFKRGFGGRVYRFVGTYDRVFQRG